MGTMNHNAILATTWSDEIANSFQKWIEENFVPFRFLRSEKVTNNYQTFVMIPDGSKEGWDESGEGDRLRQMVIARLERDKYEDDSSPWDWVEVGYGEYGQKVLRGNCHNCYSDSEYAIDGSMPGHPTTAETASETPNEVK